MRTLAVIPARGGSKGVPRKNIRLLADRPLIAWVGDAALASKRLSRVVLTTEDDEIAAVARSLGLDVPFKRPAELATDSANAVPMLQHALQECERLEGSKYDAVMMLQPTSPFCTAEDIDQSIDLLDRTGADGVISVFDVEGNHPARMYYLEGDQLISPPFCEAYENQARQELPVMYLRNGAIFLTRRDNLLNGSLRGRDCRAHIMPAERSVNIDSTFDFELADWLMRRRLAASGEIG